MPNNDTPATVSQPAPVPERPVAEIRAIPIQPRPKRIERQGVRGAPAVHHYPQVRGGICEFCGVLDNRLPSTEQYKLCEHYRPLLNGGELRCSYCDEAKDPTEVVGHAVLNVYEHPQNPDNLVVVCDSYECTRKHQQRFETAG